MNDLRFAFHQLLKSPGHAAIPVLALALGFNLVDLRGAQSSARTSSFAGAKAGDETQVGGVKLCWCPPGRFVMGSPRGEPERRPGEDQVEVTLTKGFWMGKYEVTQGQWHRVIGQFQAQLTAGEGDDFPVYSINFAEAEEIGRAHV